MNDASPSPTERERIVFWFVLISLIVLALYWRTSVFERDPSGFHPARYLVGAIRARQIWFEVRTAPLTPAEQAWLDADVLSLAEPPLLEGLTVLAYLATGSEQPWVAQVWSTVFWLVAGWPLYCLTRRLTGQPLAGLIALGVFWMNPLAVVISQMFQPDALMILALVTALAAMLRWRPSGEPWRLVRSTGQPTPRTTTAWRNTLICGMICGAAAMIKPGISVFLLTAAYVALRCEDEWARRRSVWHWLIDLRTYVFALLLVLPSLIYARIFLPTHLEAFFIPQFVLFRQFWVGWYAMVGATITWPVALAGLLGAELHRRRTGALLPWGLWIGYLATGFFFTWHIATHNYYQTPLIVVTAIGIAGLAAWLLDRLRLAERPRWVLIGTSYLLVLAAGFYPAGSPLLDDLNKRYDIATLIDAGNITRRLGPGTRVLCIDGASGYVLTYYAWLAATDWPSLGHIRKEVVRGGESPGLEQRLAELRLEQHPSHFVVTTGRAMQLQLELEAALAAGDVGAWLNRLDPTRRHDADILLYLALNYRRLVRTQQFMIYDMATPAGPPSASGVGR